MTTYTPSSNIAELRPSATIAVSARAKALRATGRSIIDLGAGEPDFPTPAHVVEAARKAIAEGATKYTAVEGIAPLRERIAAAASARCASGPVSPAEVVVTTGTKQALFDACFSLFGAGDEVLVPTPAWTSYYDMLALARASAVVVRGSEARSLKVTAGDLIAASSPRTRAVILNSPCNPTGAVYTRAELAEIAACAAERGWWIISDEIYRAIAYDAEAPSILEVARDRSRIVVVDGVAKAFAMTGWRIGWSIAPAGLTGAMCALQSHTTSNAATPSQHAALAALEQERESAAAVAAMLSEFRARRAAAIELLERGSARFVRPEGAFYLFIKVGESSEENAAPGSTFAEALLEEPGVAVVPGSAFHAPEWIRVSYAAPRDSVLEGLSAIVDRLRGP